MSEFSKHDLDPALRTIFDAVWVSCAAGVGGMLRKELFAQELLSAFKVVDDRLKRVEQLEETVGRIIYHLCKTGQFVMEGEQGHDDQKRPFPPTERTSEGEGTQ